MNGFLWVGGALLVAWMALRAALGADADAAHLAGIAGVVLVALGLWRRAHRAVRGAAATPSAPAEDGRPATSSGRTIDLGLRRRRRHG